MSILPEQPASNVPAGYDPQTGRINEFPTYDPARSGNLGSLLPWLVNVIGGNVGRTPKQRRIGGLASAGSTAVFGKDPMSLLYDLLQKHLASSKAPMLNVGVGEVADKPTESSGPGLYTGIDALKQLIQQFGIRK